MGKKIEAEVAEIVKTLHSDHSNKEIAQKAGVSVRTVYRVAEKLGLKKTQSQVFLIRSRIRNTMIRDERRRVILGLEQSTKLKVFTNRKKSSVKYRLRRIGYLMGNDKNHLFYTDLTPRNMYYEEIGKRVGLSFERIS